MSGPGLICFQSSSKKPPEIWIPYHQIMYATEEYRYSFGKAHRQNLEYCVSVRNESCRKTICDIYHLLFVP